MIPGQPTATKSETDSKKIIPNKEATEVVKHIFQLCASGKGPSQIARQLRQEKVLTPSRYYYQKTGIQVTNLDLAWPYHWTNHTVRHILENEVYLGRTVSMRYTTLSYKNKKQIQRPESEWLRFENTHEAIIDQELWNIVQEVRKHKKRPTKRIDERPSPFSGMVYCADCGSRKYSRTASESLF